MFGQMPFVDRQEELDQIKQLIGEWDTRRVVCISGQGGIGKTCLLEEIQRQFAGEDKTPLLLADIIDFDDLALQLPENVERRLAQSLDERAFEPYLRTLLDRRKMEAAGVSLETLEEQSKRALQTWVENFNQLSSHSRVVLRFDTTEKLEREVWNRLTSLITASKNVFFILAGRNARDLWESLQPRLEQDAKLIELTPFEAAAGQEYLEEKQRLLHVTLEPELTQKLLFLTEGRPILIDLAIEWLSRNLPFDWMTKSTLKEIKSLAPDEINRRRTAIEIQLVRHITQIRSPMDRLTLAMSHVYPLNPQMIARLLKVSESEAESLFEEAKTYVFVKSVSEGHITLHDVMRDMVNVHVWPEVDQRKDRRRLYSRIGAEYLRREIQKLIDRSNQLARDQEKGRQVGDAQSELHSFIAYEALDRELWTLREQLVFHTLFTDIKEGTNTFAEVFDEAVRMNRGSFQKILLERTLDFGTEFPDAEKYEVEIRHVICLLNGREIVEAKQLLDILMSQYADGDKREVDMLTRLGNYAQLTGNLPEAISYLERALTICDANPRLREAWGGTVLNSLGWMNRLMDKWEQAVQYYRRGIELIKATGDQARLATAYNNLGYIIGSYSNYDSALIYCRQALKIQEVLGLKHDAGRTHNTMGIIYRGKEDYLASLEQSNQSITIFREFKDDEWMSKAYCERGATRWHMGQLEEADLDLERSYQLYNKTGLISELVNILHRRGHVAWELGKIEDAELYFRESAEFARRVSDFRQIVNSSEGLVELYYDVGDRYHKQGDVEKRDEWYTKAEEMAVQWKTEFEDKGYYFPLYSGSRIRVLGNIAYDRGDYESALQEYLKAYPRIASRGGYSRYMLPEALGWLQERVDQLPPQLALEWCDRIQAHWKTEGLDRDFPEILSVCEIGRDNAKRRATIEEATVE